MDPKLNPKRKMTDYDTEQRFTNASVFPLSSESWPRFIVLESLSPDTPLTKLSPFAIQKGVLAIAGTVKDAKKLRSGQILVECLKKVQADNLLSANTFAAIDIKSFPHSSLNSCKGVIRTRDLEDMEESEIAEELAPQDVTNVRRITLWRNDMIVKTNTYIVTFNKPFPPAKLMIGYQRLDVDLYIPNPIRCFKCQKFGHGSSTCKSTMICCTCGEEGHDLPCLKSPKCRNCGGPHTSSDKTCPTWMKEKEIQKTKITKRVSYPEARKLVNESPNFKLGRTFAAVVRSVTSTACQTDTTWLDKDKPQLLTSLKNQAPTKAKSSNTMSLPMPTQKPLMEGHNQVIDQDQPGHKPKKKTSVPQTKVNTEQTTSTPDQIKDIEMKDIASRRNRSQSPKHRSGSRVLSSKPK